MTTRWPKVRLAEVLRQIERPEAVDPTKAYRLLGVRWYGQGLFVREEKLGGDIAANRVYSVRSGDFIYNRLFAWKGSFAVAGPKVDGAHVSNEFPCFSAMATRLDPRFLFWYFRQERVWSEVLGLSEGATPTSRNRLKEAAFLAMEIPLPSLPEQRRLVARIEELATQIDGAQSLRWQATEEEEALSRATTEAGFRQLLDRFGARRLGDVSDTITDGDHNTPPFTETGICFIFVGNVSTGHLHFDNSRRVDERYFSTLSPHRVPARGDILYSAVGATLGIPAIVETDEPFCFQRHIAILKLNRELLDSQFTWHMLRSRSVFEKAWASTTGSAQPTVPLRAIRDLSIPIPPLEVQRQIASGLDTLQAEMDVLKRLQAATGSHLAGLRPALLDRAFKGQL